MFPPPQNIHLDIRALSGICGSISIACWVVVFSPQIIENFRRGSAEGLSVVFIVVWLVGDVFNILGAVLQEVLPTMIILAVYYTLADLVLLVQCFWYKGFTLSDEVATPNGGVSNRSGSTSGETTPLLRPPEPHELPAPNSSNTQSHDRRRYSRRSSHGSFIERHASLASASHLSPAVPFVPDPKHLAPARRSIPRSSALKSIVLNGTILLLVCAAGVVGWALWAARAPADDGDGAREPLTFNVLGQVFGYVCAALYLGSRVPQLLLNWRRKSTEGISMLFFLFACIGNATYVLSIFAYEPSDACETPSRCKPGEAGAVYARYVLVNLSWLLGSLGTLVLDAGVFVQWFLYRTDDEDNEEEETDEDEER